MTPTAPDRVFTPASATASCLSFALMGALTASYGPLIPIFQERFGVSPAEAALAISAHAAGSFVGVLVAVKALRTMTHATFLVLSVLALALGCVAFAIAPLWPILLGAALVIGIGFGMLDLGVNQLFARGFGSRSTAMINILNGVFGVGAVAGPLLIAAMAGSVTVVFLAYGVAAAVLAIPLSRVPGQEHDRGGATDDGGPVGLGGIAGPALVRVVALLSLAFLIYVGVEVSIGGWEPSHLAALGMSATAAAAATSVFWLCLTLGRFIVAPIALRVSAQRIVLACSALAVVSLVLATIPSLAPIAYAATGLAIGPIYPTGIAWLAAVTAPRRAPTAYLVAAGMLGGLVFPPIVGLVIQTFGVGAAPFVIAVLMAATAATFGAVAIAARGARAMATVPAEPSAG